MENLESSKENMLEEVVLDAWIIDGLHKLRIPPGTHGHILGKGSAKDYRVQFDSIPFVEEVNKEELL